MTRSSSRAPDLALLDLTDDSALANIIRMKAHATVPKNQRERIILALKRYTDHSKLTNKYVKIAPKHDEFGDKVDLDTSELTPQDIRERISDVIISAGKKKVNAKTKPTGFTPKSTNANKHSMHHNEISPSPKRMKKTRLTHNEISSFPNAKKKIPKESNSEM